MSWLYAADLPVKQIILYKHGIGYFEREGSVNAGEDVRLDFQNNDMNDVLKSLTVVDTSGGRIRAVRYDSNESPEQRLQKFPFQIGDQQNLSSFLDRLKGSRLQLAMGDKAVAGVIMAARLSNTTAPNGAMLTREQITLLLDSGDLANYDLSAASSLRLLDTHLQQELKDYLGTLEQSRSREKRSVYIEASEAGGRHLQASYISPAAVWKSSYRLTLAAARSNLEGWAIVDNTTDEDWRNVQLAVVSGRPISFISLLDTPRFGARQVAELPEDRAAGPVAYSGAVDGAIGGVIGGVGTGSGNGMGAGSAGGVYKVAPAMPAQAQTVQVESQAVTRADRISSVEGATGATLGELFEYTFPGPVTIKKNQSAMLPFLQDKVDARKLLIYTERDGEHPVNAAEIVNNTGKTLDGGPITVYDGGGYAGEALFETLKTGDRRLIGYAVDYGTRITTAFDSADQLLRDVHIVNGNLNIKYTQRQTRTYTIRNVDSKPKSLIVEQNSEGYSLISPKPSERTSNAYRFEVKLPANGSQKLKVEQDQDTWNTLLVTNATPDFLATIADNKDVSAAARTQLAAVADLKKQVTLVQAQLDSSRTELNDLSTDQSRLRQNIDSLNRVKGEEEQVRKYSADLSANETQIARLRDENRSSAVRRAQLDGKLRDAILKLEF